MSFCSILCISSAPWSAERLAMVEMHLESNQMYAKAIVFIDCSVCRELYTVKFDRREMSTDTANCFFGRSPMKRKYEERIFLEKIMQRTGFKQQ